MTCLQPQMFYTCMPYLFLYSYDPFSIPFLSYIFFFIFFSLVLFANAYTHMAATFGLYSMECYSCAT